jgi:glycosyltransferase involved in cell wall biosynthesis
MKIVQAIGWYYPESSGGTEVYVAELSRRLRAAGHDVLVATPDPAAAAERTYDHDGVPVYRYPIPPAPTRAESQGRVPVRGAERFHAWLQRQHADVVHVHTFVTGLGAAELRVAKATGARVIVTTHSSSLGYVCQRGSMMRWGERLCDGVCDREKCAACELQHRGLPKALAATVARLPLPLARFAGKMPGKIATALGLPELIVHNQSMQRAMLEAVDKFVLLTQWAFDAVVANGALPERLALNRLGVSQDALQPKPGPTEQPTQRPVAIGYLGRFDPIKGVYDLARAVTSLQRDVAVRLEFRGPLNSNADRHHLRELQRIVGEDPRVTFPPAVPLADVPSVLARYDALCCPSVCVEGGPTVALEAYAVGTPVIGTRIGGLAELVTDGVNGRLVAPGDWKALGAVLQAVAADPGSTIDRWRRSLPRVRTMESVAADYVALYEERQ